MPVPAILAAMGSLAAGAMNNNMADSNAEKAFGRQKELMALQQQYAVENWQRENNYNTPAAQRQRLKAAGLNPDLMYGNGAAGLQAGSVAAPTAPSAPMAQTIPFGNPIAEGAQAALAMNQAKQANSETVAQDIENQYLAKRFEADIQKTMQDIAESGSRVALNQETIANIAQSTANLKVEADALQTRLGYEETDRLISMFEAVTNRLATLHKINDDMATRSARIFSLVAKGHLDEANAYIVGLFKDPEKAKKWVKDWAKVIKETWNELFGDDEGKDSEGHSTYSPLNKNPKSKAAKFARSFFMALDQYTTSFLGAPEQPWHK